MGQQYKLTHEHPAPVRSNMVAIWLGQRRPVLLKALQYLPATGSWHSLINLPSYL